MTKFKTLLLTLLILAFPLATVYAETNENEKADYTIMIYMNGSTLESGYDYAKNQFRGHASNDLEEMIKGFQEGSNINVIVETIGTKKWVNDYVDSKQTQRFLLSSDGFVLKDSLPPQNAGYKKGLSDFITWGTRSYPAERYALILWNHGGGPVGGFGLDTYFNNDVLHLEELSAALDTAKEKTSLHFDAIGFDACLMASLEVADALAPYADYLIASEEFEPSHGWDYKAILEELYKNPSVNGDQLGKIVADTYLAHAEEIGESHNTTLSVIDLAKVPAIVVALEQFIQTVQETLYESTNFYNFAIAAASARSFGGNTESQGYTDLIDINDFAQLLSEDLESATAPLISAVKDAVIYKTDGTFSKNTSGLSLYFPLRDRKKYQKKIKIYKETGFSATYIDFVEKFNNTIIDVDDGKRLNYDLKKPNDTYDFYHIDFDEKDNEKLSNVFLEVTTFSENDNYPDHSYISLGYDNQIFYDESDQVYMEQFDKEWKFLETEPLLLKLMTVRPDGLDYESPVLYNKQHMNLIFSYDKVIKEDTDEATYEFNIHGLRRGIDPETGKPDKEIYQFHKGDTIRPLYLAYHVKRRRLEWIEGNELNLTPSTSIHIKDIEADNYILAFRYINYYLKPFSTNMFLFER